MAKKKGKRKPPAGPFRIQPGKCRVVKGTVKVCVSKTGAITYSAPKRRATKKAAPGVKKTPKRKPAKGVRLETGQVVRATKASPATARSLRRVPKTIAERKKRNQRCRSETFNAVRKGKPPQCSCFIVTKQNKVAVQTLQAGPCPGVRDMRTQEALKVFRKGGLSKGRKRLPAAPPRLQSGAHPTITGLGRVKRRRPRRGRRRARR